MSKIKEVNNPHFFQVSLKVLLKNDKGEVLILKLPESSSMNGFYDLPGGRINTEEINDLYENIIDRELREELGSDFKYRVSLSPVSFSSHVYFSKHLGKDNSIFFVFIEGEYLGGKIVLSGEHCEFAWVDPMIIDLNKIFFKGIRDGIANIFNG